LVINHANGETLFCEGRPLPPEIDPDWLPYLDEIVDTSFNTPLQALIAAFEGIFA